MNNSAEPDLLNQLDTVFTQLDPQAVEQFYLSYQQWTLQQRVADLQQRVVLVRQQQADNEQRIQQTQPSPIALAALARLQSNGVSDIELLDTMLERGEAWLDQTMQRLDYCEQFNDFISDDYTQWCQRALEGAFDWIDSLREATDAALQAESATPDAPAEIVSTDSDEAEVVEALLLQKLASEEEQEDVSWQEITLKQTAVKLPQEEMAAAAPEETETFHDAAIAAASESEQPDLVEFNAPPELSPAEDTVDNVYEQAAPTEVAAPEDIPAPVESAQSEMNEPTEVENSATEEAAPHEEQVKSIAEPTTPARNVPRKRGWLRRLIYILSGK